ncbi:flavin reductase family protein [Amphibacillus cookii]|uniref:flavin reductase family protein n=1 Tax=Amphibacillus cookii TaxID=767787 RepID=UPI00195A404A|nr:flavin reductase family protein [Amphibacillus cookii]MBM7540278.1 flavin reductase (DIM6/NTAB) family NADH-FMN oxidoreductase RutF [Amphibacillus cookii]
MKAIDPKTLTAKDNYKFLIGSVIPRPIAFVTSLGKDDTLNGAPYSFFNVVSSEPPMISIAAQQKDGQRKHTAQNILERNEFVVHIVDQQTVEQVNQTAATLDAKTSEVTFADLTAVNSDYIETPGIDEAKIRMECRLYKHIELPTTDLILGEIICYHIDEALYANGRIDETKLQAVSRLAGDKYANIGEVFSINRPK